MRMLRLTAEQYYRLQQRNRGVTKPTRSKYGNVKTSLDGEIFASAKEARRWAALRLLEATGEIQELRRQLPYSLDVNEVHVAVYIADFAYRRGGRDIVEDAKGYRTGVYRLKRKLMLALHHIEVLET